MEVIPINQSEREEMEDRLEFKVCPFTAKNMIPKLTGYGPSYGFSAIHYICAVDGGKARGGKNEGQDRVSGHGSPCSFEYAKTCPLYQSQISDFLK